MSTFDGNSPSPEDENEEEDKESLAYKRKRKHQYDFYVEQIELTSTVCRHLDENKKYAEKQLSSLKKEKEFREERLEDLKTQYEAIKGQSDDNNKNTVEKIKAHIIKESLHHVISNKIPELNLQQDKNPAEMLGDADFKGLIHDTINVIYTKYENSNVTERFELQRSFKISKSTVFSNLKKTACSFWELASPELYLLTTDEEAVIYNEEMIIDDFMKLFSVRSNIVRLVNSNILKARNKLLPIQEDKCREVNKVNQRQKGEMKMNYGSGSEKLKEFLVTYSGIGPYLRKEKEELFFKEGEIKQDAKRLGTSLIMLVLNLLIFILTILFLVRKDYSTLYNYRKVNAITQYFNFNESYMTRERAYQNLLENLQKLSYLQNNDNLGFDYIGHILIVSESVKEKDCDVGLKCYESHFSKKKVMDRENYATNGCKLSVVQYKKKGTVGKFDFETITGDFTGPGTYVELSAEDLSDPKFFQATYCDPTDTSAKEFKEVTDILFPAKKCRGLTMTFNLYFRDEDIFTNVIMHYNVLPTGIIETTPIMVYPFVDSPYKGGYLVQEIFRFIFVIAVLVFFVADFIWQKKIGKPVKPLEYFISFDFLSSAIIFVFYFAVFIMRMILKDGGKLFDLDKYNDTFKRAKQLNYANFMDGIILVLTTFKLLSFERITSFAIFITVYLEKAIQMFIIYFVFILIFITGFAVGGKLLFAYNIEEYSGFGSSFVSVIFFICGFYNVEDMLEYNYGFAIAYCIILSFINLLLIFGVLYAIFAETFRKTLNLTGHAEDVDHEEWDVRDYKCWALHFITEEPEHKKAA